jgi:pimeloyl-ACP methyl ester carboxylesterase
MHVAEAGRGEPIVMLHGWPQHWYLWRHVIPLLAPHHRLICPDLRGFGWTDVPAGGYDKETLARDVVALLDALELERVGLMGHDWGGWTGFLVALAHPQRVSRFVALNIVPPWPSANARALRSLWRFWYQVVVGAPWLGRAAVGGGLARSALTGNLVRRDAITPTEVEAFTERLTGPRARASEQLYRTFVLRELGPLLAGRYRAEQLAVPTRLLFGERDAAISGAMVDGYEGTPGLEIERTPDSGHFVVDEKPDWVAERALEFFARDAPRGDLTAV